MENLQGGTLALEHRYDVLEHAGRHGFVTLYRGRQDPFAKKVWVKAYDGLADAGAGVELFDRLKQTGKRVSSLATPGVLRIVDYGELEGGIPFVISERCEGVSLSELLVREGTLSAEATASLLRRLAAVLEPAHQAGCAHGSISPRWIYVAHERFDEAMVDHFQLAVTVGEIRAAENAVMSIPAISAFPPEMFERAGDDDQTAGFAPAGDIWSLGALAYSALVGVHPFFEDDLDASEGILRLQNEQARPLSELGVDPQISQVVERALSKAPGERFESVTEFADAFSVAVDPSASCAKASPFAKASAPERAESAPTHPTPAPPRSLDDPGERQPGPSDRLLTAVIVLLFLSNLAWLFYVAGSSAVEEPSEPAANKPHQSSVITNG